MNESHGPDYSPEIVDRWLRQWDLLESLAESPRTSVHMLRFNHAEHQGPCSTGPRIGGGRPSDGLAWAIVKADIEAAAKALPIESLERQVVLARIAGAGPLGHIATILRYRKATVCEAYQRAIVMMAEQLGWVDDGQAIAV